MAVVTVASTKGGAGKSTTVANIAAVAYQAGASVGVLDCDPQKHSKAMLDRYMESMRKEFPEKVAERKALNVIDNCTSDTILDVIDQANERHDLVLVDLQGTANQMMTFAMSESDLVLVPVQASELDIDGAGVAWSNLLTAERVAKRGIPGRLFFTRVPAAIQPKVLTKTRAKFAEMGIPVLNVELLERSIFKEATFDGKFPTEWAPQTPAADNVRALYREILTILHNKVAGSEKVA